MSWEDRDDRLSPEEAQLFERAKRSLPLCPEESRLRGFLYDVLPPDVYAATKSHVDGCELCAARLEVLEAQDNRRPEITPADADALLQDVLRASRSKKTFAERAAVFFASLNLWRAAAAFTAVFALVVGLAVYRQTLSPEMTTPPGVNPVRGEIELLRPERAVTSFPVRFEWEKVSGVHHYELTILDARTGRTVLALKNLPSETALVEQSAVQLQSGQSYLWEVKGFSARGDLVAASARKGLTVEGHR